MNGERAVSTHKRPLTKTEIQKAFENAPTPWCRPIVSVEQLAQLLTDISPKTVLQWISKGRLDGAFRKRGKRYLIWRDRALELLFNGAEWND
jgi:hypothetical protein